VNQGGLGEDISDLPVAGIVPEWMSEKALSIGTYFVASGVSVIFGFCSPVAASTSVSSILKHGWRDKLGASLELDMPFVSGHTGNKLLDSKKIVGKVLDHIKKKRELLGIPGIGGRAESPAETAGRGELRQWQMKLRDLLRQQ
jgi:carbon-monoxide dehydrogenase catalytic subunit